MALHAPLSAEILERIIAASQRLKEKYPFGFDHSHGFGSSTMVPRRQAPKPTDRAPTIIYHNAGFLEPDLFLPLFNPQIAELIERVVGKDFYLSNIWMQIVPPGTGRMGYHKDEHGSVSITMPLDTIGWNSGSTCLVPKTHCNTPPPNFCLENIMTELKDEAQLTGGIGDVIFFTPEAWHGRAANTTEQATCRLFFNFYSRTSRDSTRWSPCISGEQLEAINHIVPEKYLHMLRIDPPRVPPIAGAGKFRNWVMQNGSSSSATNLQGLVREYFYWKFSRQEPITRDARGQKLPAYRTTITESDRFSFAVYLSHLNWFRTLKISVRSAIDTVLSCSRINVAASVKSGD